MMTYISLQDITAAKATAELFKYCVYAYKTPNYSLRHTEKQSVPVFFGSVRGIRGFEHYFTTAHHAQSNEQTERLNETNVQRVQKNVGYYAKNWDQRL